MTAPSDDTTTDLHAVIEALRAERDAALSEKATLTEALVARTAELLERKTAFDERMEYQAATNDVLKVMSASPDDPQPVFDLIATRARDLCDAYGVSVHEFDGSVLHLRAYSGVSDDPKVREAYEARYPMPLTREVPMARAIIDRRVIRFDDFDAPGLSIVRGEVSSAVAVPMMRGDAPIGGLIMGSRERGSFSNSQIELLKTFAEQAVIAISNAETYRALQERTATLATRNSEYGERIEHQAATIDVLKAMSASPGDAQPVFDLIVRQAKELCNCVGGALYEYDGELVHLRTNYVGDTNAATVAKYVAMFPMAPTRASFACRAILEREVVHIRDTDAELEQFAVMRGLDRKAQISVPLLRDGVAIGAIALGAEKAGDFSDSQVALLQTFAEQAAIAISSAETYRALQTRTSDLQETLEYQTATSDVLKVISRSTFDLQPVLDTVVEAAARLCDADQAAIFNFEDGMVRLTANIGFPLEYQANFDARGLTRLATDSPGVLPRAARERRVVHVHDAAAVPGYSEAAVKLVNVRTALGVPFLREDETIGVIVLSRRHVEPFTEQQIALVSTFADQAVIAIENTRLITEQREALEQQTATAEVLQVINASPGDLAPVFDAMLEKAMRLCEAAFGLLATFDGERWTPVVLRGVPAAYAEYRMHNPISEAPGGMVARVMRGARVVHVRDLMAEDAYRDGDPDRVAIVDVGGARTSIAVGLRKDNVLLGSIQLYRQEVRPFSDRQVALLENFAAQAVIAMENARLIDEQREALEQQTATAEVLQVINESPGNLTPVFDAVLEKAIRLCASAFGMLATYDGHIMHYVAMRGLTPEQEALLVDRPLAAGQPTGRIGDGENVVHLLDARDQDGYRAGFSPTRNFVDQVGARTAMWVALRKDKELLGILTIFRREVRAFTDKEVALIQNFTAQAVIAMENARLLDEIRQRQEELRVTFENMGDGVAMFDETPRLVAWNRKFQEIFDVPDALLVEQRTYGDYIRYLAERGDYGSGTDVEEQVHRITANASQHRTYERTRPDGQVIEIRNNPVAGGGFVLIYADITERKRSEAEIRAARDAAEEASRTIEAAYRELKTAQANLIQAEKMASLGQLTAGIAHEIKNPLNFINNFSDLSVEMLGELKETAAPGFAMLPADRRAEIDDVIGTLTSNLERITEHGRRADGIVKAMLEHSRGSSGERRVVDLNALIDEALNLAYHGARAQDQSFNVTLERDFGAGVAPIEVNPQDITRVFLNLFSNGFYAVTRRARDGGDAEFVPMLKVTTRDAGEAVEIRVRDNGTGIPADIRDKLFQPFFTTKPTGEGTGLGLSITYDIVTKQHGGSITVGSVVGEYSEFTIRLPRKR